MLRTSNKKIAILVLLCIFLHAILFGFLANNLHAALYIESDDFNDGIADGWTPANGTWTVESGEYSVNIAKGNVGVSAMDVSVTGNPTVIETDFIIRADGAAKNAFIVFDYQGFDNHKIAGTLQGSSKWVIGSIVGNNSWTFPMQYIDPTPVDTERWYRVRIEINGTVAKLYVDDDRDGSGFVLKAQYDYGSMGSGRIGQSTIGAHAHFDNVYIESEYDITPVQELAAFADDSTGVEAPATNLRMVKISTTGINGGLDLTGTSVRVDGTLSDLTDIRVWWNTTDDFNTATAPAVGAASNIALTGAGNGTGYLYYTISFPGGALGSYSVTVESVTGASADSIPLPRSTLTRTIIAPPPVSGKIFTISDNLEAPSAVGIDSSERIYVAESAFDRINVYSPTGKFIKSFSGFGRPVYVAVDTSNRVLVADVIRKNVKVYDTDFNFLFDLGSGNNEFKKPCSIDTDSTGRIYVADCKADKIKIYNPDGTFNYSFGTSGSSPGQLNGPTGVAVDESAGELIIVDKTNDGGMMGSYLSPRVQVFDMNGVGLRSFGVRGVDEGKLFRPLSVAVDSLSRIYVSDTYSNIVQVFDNQGNSLGIIHDPASPVRTPQGVTVTDDNKLYVASQNTDDIVVYGIDDYLSMVVSPFSLYYQEAVGSVVTGSQDINITNNGTQSFGWTASTSETWVTLSQDTGSLNPSETAAVSVGVDVTGFATLEVIEAPLPELSVTPSSLTYVSINGSVPQPQSLTIENIGADTLDWTASADSTWIQLDKVSGTAPDMTNVTVDPATLSEGTHTGNITIDGGNAINSPMTIPVTFEVIVQTGTINVNTNLAQAIFTITGPNAYAGGGASWSVPNAPVGTYMIIYGNVSGYITPSSEVRTLSDNSAINFTGQYQPNTGSISVTTNNPGATFTIDGPASYSGSGTSWLVSDAPEGTYTINFGDVNGYSAPAPQTKTLETDSSISFTGNYVTLSRNIISGLGAGQENIGRVKVFNADGTQTLIDDTLQWYDHGANVAAGDIDGDGFDEIITAPGKDPTAPADIRVFDRNGNELHNLNIYAFDYNTYLHGATIASADFDGDGYDEVIAGTGPDRSNPAYVKIFVYDPDTQSLVDSGIGFSPYNKDYGVNVTAGDVDGDGTPELITSPGPGNKYFGEIRIWDIDTSHGTGQWSAALSNEFTVQSEYKYSQSIASADVNGDGIDEIITGDGPHSKARDVVRIFDQSGTLLNVWQAGTAFNGYGAKVASGDLDNDGIADIIVAPGPGAGNQAHIKVFDINGTTKADFYPFNTQYGATVAVGYLGLE
jgi:hypothetical protein